MDKKTTHSEVQSALPGFTAPTEVVELLGSLWKKAASDIKGSASSRDVAQTLRGKLGETNGGWEAGRVRAARQALDTYLENAETHAPVPALLARAEAQAQPIALTFGGQSSAYIEEIALTFGQSFVAARLIDTVSRRLEEVVAAMPAHERAYLPHGLHLSAWARNPETRPPAAILQGMISQPLIFVCQIAHYLRLLESGYNCPEFWRNLRAAAGHSQGVMAALFVSETLADVTDSSREQSLHDRAADYATYLLYQGLRMQQIYPNVGLSPDMLAELAEIQGPSVGTPSAMASVVGLTTPQLNQAVKGLGLNIYVTLDNTRLRKVVSGRPEDLEQLRRFLVDDFDRKRKGKSAGRYAGALPERDWQYLSVAAPFHSPYMEPGMTLMRSDVQHLGFSIAAEDLHIAVLDTATGEDLRLSTRLMERLIELQFIEPVRWDVNVRALVQRGAQSVLDFGPGEGCFRLTASNLKGFGVTTLGIALEEGRRSALEKTKAPAVPMNYEAFAPKLVQTPDQKTALDNRYTRWTGRSPVILPGMTPTTVEADIVAAAANGGFVSELAGGGQVTEKILRQRMTELRGMLKPGQGIVFNALYLDPYLWKLHFGDGGLVMRLREEGEPIIGVTVSAGIPPLEEAVSLLREFNRRGIWLNSFKPGTDRQIKEILAIADAVPDIEFAVHIEGGKAGGHHSWEDLTDVLSRNYDALRQRHNIHICVGGGIAREDQGTDYLTGVWSTKLGLAPMPVDAFFLGTVTMAVKEAKTSRAVKEALVAAKGTEAWVLDGEFAGDTTSGRSQLDAPIHYLDNSASRCGRLLDAVAKDPESIQARRDEIIAALNKTAKPYFGDVESMTYAAFLRRMIDLMAIGDGSPYEDGVWLDVSHRERVLAMFHVAEARLVSDKSAPFKAVVAEASALDAPAQAMARFLAAYPQAEITRMHPDDVSYFIEVCRRPGKPVNFVPVVDSNVRRWYKSDSLWQAHSDRFSADQVLVIPGPEAVAGIRDYDEPVATLLARFDQHAVSTLVTQGCAVTEVPSFSARTQERFAPTSRPQNGTKTVSDVHIKNETRWYNEISKLGGGALAAAIASPSATLRDNTATELGSKLSTNPLRQLLAPSAGATLTWYRERDGALRELSIRDATGHTCAYVRMGETRGNITPLRALLLAPDVRSGGDDVAMDLGISWVDDASGPYLAWDRSSYLEAQSRFYGQLLFGRVIDAVSPFTVAKSQVTVRRDDISSFLLTTHDDTRGLMEAGRPAQAPANMVFALAWEAVFRALAGAKVDVINLLHEDNEVEAGPGWPLMEGDCLAVAAQVVGMVNLPAGLRTTVTAELSRNGQRVAHLRTNFFIRGSIGNTHEIAEPYREKVRLSDVAACEFLASQPWLQLRRAGKFSPQQMIEIDCPVFIERLRPTTAFQARGTVRDVTSGEVMADILLAPEHVPAGCIRHPVAEVCRLLGATKSFTPLTTVRELGRKVITAPTDMSDYARASGDFNPLHTATQVARFAGLPHPIVHGMWTASAAVHRAARLAASGRGDRVVALTTRFLSTVDPGAELAVSVRQVGMKRGCRVVEIEAQNAEGTTVVSGKVTLAPPRTAYIFPGQGLQRQNMGMNGYQRSKAAKAVWDEAEKVCREKLGFSLLRIVRENPKEMLIDGQLLRHPAGVLFLTQFTQVAMSVMAIAQVRELEESGAFVENAVFCGHSVGEYSAISAISGTLTLAAIVEIVYNRGCTMDTLVSRDSHGRSPYAMGVIRPHYAKMSEKEAQQLVSKISSELGLPLEIVNYNVRGRQYSVTGDTRALDRLKNDLAAVQRQRGGEAKAAYLEVPGIDVPFHSTLLRSGVPVFREVLERCFPTDFPVQLFEGRYIPNLVAQTFTLTREFVETTYQVSQSPVLAAILANWEQAFANKVQLARTLVIELLAYQFASPVRWIETQDILISGQGAVEQMIEIGLGEQPVLANMTKVTLTQVPYLPIKPRVLNSEANFDELFGPSRTVEQDNLTVTAPATVQEVAAPAAAAKAAPAAVAAPVVVAAAASSSHTADAMPTAAEALRVMLALQTKLRGEQIGERETLDELLGGNSARRNQVLADIGAEFGIGAIDGAHDLPLADLAKQITSRASKYQAPGKYLTAAIEQALAKSTGAARFGRGEVVDYLSRAWAMGPGRSVSVLMRLALLARAGASARGGQLSDTPPQVTDKTSAEAWIDGGVQTYAKEAGIALNKPTAGVAASATVDAGALRELGEKLWGEDGVLSKTAELWQRAGGNDPMAAKAVGTPSKDASEERLAAYDREHGADYEAAVAPRFDADKHVAFTSSWAWTQRDVAAMAANLRRGVSVSDADVAKLAARMEPRAEASVLALIAKAERDGQSHVAERLDSLLAHHARGSFVPAWRPQMPTLKQSGDGAWFYSETARPKEATPADFVQAVLSARDAARAVGADSRKSVPEYAHALAGICRQGLSLAGKTALITGASPGSIAVEIARIFLAAGARVVLSTSSYNETRLAFYRGMYQECAAAGAELHIIPANQGCFADVDALVSWATQARTETVGASEKKLKGPWVIDYLMPFGALGEVAYLSGLGAKSQAVLRVLLLGVERMIARVAETYKHNTLRNRRCHVLLPLSPNHGSFGGDGAYGEAKAGLEALIAKWRSEHNDWGQFVSLVGARIGWVRGTGLMNSNDLLSARLETDTGVRTFATHEMALLLAGACTAEMRTLASTEPLFLELTGGFSEIPNLAERVGEIRAELSASAVQQKRKNELKAALSEALQGVAKKNPATSGTALLRPTALPKLSAPVPTAGELATLPELDHLDLKRMVVVVGYGEVSPYGSARTRWQVERDGALALEAVAELAWMTGLIRPTKDGAGWEDVASGQAIDDFSIREKYEAAVLKSSGIRFTEPVISGFNPDAAVSFLEVHLEKDFSFTVPTREAAEELREADPANTMVVPAGEQFTVVRKRGAKVRVQRALKVPRKVAGQIPAGWDARRYGVPNEFIEQVDRTSLFNLVATAEAFLAAGLTPEELYAYLHPARVGCTQSSGIGGMQKLRRLYRDFYDGATRQTDTLQETLINVIAGYVVQSYLGSYGPMSFPVAACATAAVSVQSAVDKIMQNEADFMVAGGVDDYGEEGAVGFSDMAATAATETMERMGMSPKTLSRPNDRRRRGFCESQGAGAVLLARASLAMEAGLPVYGIVAYAGCFGDGINRSVPAPGLGALAVAAEGPGAKNPHDACDIVGRRAKIKAVAAHAEELKQLVGEESAEALVADARRRFGHDFYREGGADISPLRGALAVFGLGPDDVALVSKHDTSTQANDINENRLHQLLQDKLGRTPNLPLWVVSQKSLTGHPKGAAAAWQMGGLMQAMADGVVPGNPNMEDVDPNMTEFSALTFNDRKVQVGSTGIKAGLVTSLGFGHVGALVALVHPFFFWRALSSQQSAHYHLQLTKRQVSGTQKLQRVLSGREPMVVLRTKRPFAGKDGTSEQSEAESSMLLNANARMGTDGTFPLS